MGKACTHEILAKHSDVRRKTFFDDDDKVDDSILMMYSLVFNLFYEKLVRFAIVPFYYCLIEMRFELFSIIYVELSVLEPKNEIEK